MKKIVTAACMALTITQLAFAQTENNKIYYHLTFPAAINEKSESITLDANTTDLIMSNMIAGGLYARLIQEKFPDLKFNQDYLVGSLLGQLMQENLQTSDYQSASPWINPNDAIRTMLLAPGQGGPYQLNDYSKRLEDKLGMINFVVLQKSLNYSIQDQDSGVQTTKPGPLALDDKYFGPIAAAYFHFNDLLRLQAINQDAWGPEAPYFNQCITNLSTTNDNNFLDMIMNATYNAGPWADITKTYIQLCANLNNVADADKISHINDYALSDEQYQQAVGTHEAVGSTFILYPRQIRFYLDELYNNQQVLPVHNAMPFLISDFRATFVRAMTTLGYVDKAKQYVFISANDAANAFNIALISVHLNQSETIDISDAKARATMMLILELSFANLANKLNIQFSDTTETTLNGK